MGITGLLPFLKKIHEQVNVSKFEGCTVAIDAYCWLHKGAFSCAEKLALGEATDQYVYYCMKYIENLLKNNIKPILVFDGCRLPSKKDVEKSRKEKRDLNRMKAAQLLREGKRVEARECLQRCIDISPEMALKLMNVCRAQGVDCIVAPYEADAQLAYLNKAGIAQVIVTEDSDLLLFGCEKVIFKMDFFGNGILIEQRRLNEVMDIQNCFYSFDKFRYMCILSGCDYLPSLPGIGLGKASKVFKLARQTDLRLNGLLSLVEHMIVHRCFIDNGTLSDFLFQKYDSEKLRSGRRHIMLLKKFPSTYLNMSMSVSEDYIEGFIQANNTFLYQLVYDPIQRKLLPLNPYPDGVNVSQMPYAGPYISESEALQIALGNINIYTMERFADFDPNSYVPPKASKKSSSHLHMLSIWNKNYRIKPKIELREVQNINRPVLQGKEVIIKKSFSIKRPKPEDDRSIRTDNEFCSLYQDNDENSPSPPTKKRSGDSDEELSTSPVKKYRKLYMSPNKVQFFDSLKEADNDTSLSVSQKKSEPFIKSPEKLMAESPTSSSSSSVKSSPKRNKFAVITEEKRMKFNVNAKREIVKSRFFASSADMEEANVKSKIIVADKETKIGVHNLTLPEAKTELIENGITYHNTVITNQLNLATQNKVSSTKIAASKPSPGSVFTWSKFKFSARNNQSNTKQEKVDNRFKNEVSESSISSPFSLQGGRSFEECGEKRTKSNNLLETFSESCASTASSQEDGLSHSQDNCVSNQHCTDSQKNDVSLTQNSFSCSQQSDCYSIDLECLPDSEEVQQVNDEYLALKKFGPSQHEKEDKIGKTSSNVTVNARKSESIKPGCRASGLSKNRKSKIQKMPGRQHSIKDLFSRFALYKSEPKIKLEANDDDEELLSSSQNDAKVSPVTMKR